MQGVYKLPAGARPVYGVSDVGMDDERLTLYRVEGPGGTLDRGKRLAGVAYWNRPTRINLYAPIKR